MSIPERLAGIQKSFRVRRMRKFAQAFPSVKPQWILDVGGTADIWGLQGDAERNRVVLLNMPRAGANTDSVRTGMECVHGDGCYLPFADQAFDIVFSNSVIEHVGDAQAQMRFAREVARAGKGYWVQTPNRYFPIETHLLTPLVHLMPRAWRAFIVRRFTVWQWVHRPAPDEKRFYIEHFVSDIRLLSASELQRLFPDGTILRERFLGFTKSLVAYRQPAAQMNPR
jgi:SAM-dependent methyltransferase